MPHAGSDFAAKSTLSGVGEDLKLASDELRQLAENLRTRQKYLSEIEANYNHLRQFVYAKFREEFERSLGPLPDVDLASLAEKEEALPLEAFIDEIEQTAGGN